MAATGWTYWRDPGVRSTTSDVFAILVAASLPWSTTLVAVFAIAFLVSIVPYLDTKALLQSLRRLICALPIALFVLAVLGMLWSDASWRERLHAVGPAAKLLMIPLLLYHFERSARALKVLMGFLASCVVLMLLSWIVTFEPHLALKSDAAYGVPVKNYIDQSQEFALCAVVLAYPVVILWRAQKFWLAVLLIALSLGFVANMLFVSVSRTALVTMPIMLAVFALLHLKWRSIVAIACLTAVLGGLAWATSPKLRGTAQRFLSDYQLYHERNEPTSLGLRLVFWQKSLRFISEAPIFGHGTGSIRGLFEEAAINQHGADAEVIGNPHNQTLNVAVQWGAIGVALLYVMWLMHLLLFRGEGLAAWIGLMIVLQNVFTSLFNSHIFDFHEGWMYVLGVGVAGGMVLRNCRREENAQAARA
ncbi:MAG TPA: O-antigen ligase family protein [Bradyrhizobium sp.]|nr:O-antigen ligase family protein [Bradyrhizobium sp.]HKO73178.1 O-antigen ligase family protein [Bradyrhizobium sp.]